MPLIPPELWRPLQALCVPGRYVKVTLHIVDGKVRRLVVPQVYEAGEDDGMVPDGAFVVSENLTSSPLRCTVHAD